MIYVECYPDEDLVRALTRHAGGISHEGGKPRVLNRLQRTRGRLGLVEEDPGSAQHPYLRRLGRPRRFAQHDLLRFEDHVRRNTVVVLCPTLEHWVLEAAAEAGIDVATSYSLPRDPRALHDAISVSRPPRRSDRQLGRSSFQRFLRDLVRNGPARVRQLQALLR